MLNSLFTEINPETSATVTGGFNFVNFDASGYAFGIGAGATFNGGVTANVVDSAFQNSTSSRQAQIIGYRSDGRASVSVREYNSFPSTIKLWYQPIYG